ncbi:MAG: HAMP domain-containing sensor histidine kinase [Solirubrobacteraceae bacterium]
MSLQRRVLGYLALAAVLSCALTVGVAVVLVRHRLATQRVANLESQASLLAVAGGAPGALAAGDHVYRVGSGHPRRTRPVVTAAVVAAIPSGDAQGTVTIAGRSLLYVARTTANGRIVLIRGAQLAFSEWRPFLVSLVLAGLGGALLAGVLGFLLARRLTRPIGELAGATERLAAGESGVEVPVEGEDELAGLGRSFNSMSAELSRARESQRRFLESVSHELKTPLTSIRGYAEALDEGAVAPSEGGRVIASEADRLERLVFDLLDLARLGRADFAVEHRPVDLTAVSSTAVERHAPRARELGVTLTGSGETDAWGIGDEGRLLQAISNLIENALRLTPAGGSVTVAAGAGRISVRDTGPGLADEDLPHAFDSFYLYNRYRSERAVGSGLGLAIVKELTAAMGGGVQATRPPGGGAEFTLTVPPAPAPAVVRR